MKLFSQTIFKIFLILTILFGCATTEERKDDMSSGKFYIQDGYIYGPEMSGKFYIQDGYIYGPKNSGKYYIRNNYIYGPKKSGRFYIRGNYIYGPNEQLPWLED